MQIAREMRWEMRWELTEREFEGLRERLGDFKVLLNLTIREEKWNYLDSLDTFFSWLPLVRDFQQIDFHTKQEALDQG